MEVKKICTWVKKNDKEYVRYHDEEWGKPIYKDRELFELFCLETQASGLSWLTILKKRDAYRKAFYGFDIDKVVNMKDDDLEEIMKKFDVIKMKKKLESIVSNAKCFKTIRYEFGSLEKYFWGKVNFKTIVNSIDNPKNVQTKNKLSDIMAQELKTRGFKFIGSITVYSFLQACGIINDHENTCYCKGITYAKL